MLIGLRVSFLLDGFDTFVCAYWVGCGIEACRVLGEIVELSSITCGSMLIP